MSISGCGESFSPAKETYIFLVFLLCSQLAGFYILCFIPIYVMKFYLPGMFDPWIFNVHQPLENSTKIKRFIIIFWFFISWFQAIIATKSVRSLRYVDILGLQLWTVYQFWRRFQFLSIKTFWVNRNSIENELNTFALCDSKHMPNIFQFKLEKRIHYYYSLEM